ncbi:MAG: MMPL family transporter [Thermoleophilaceae bacterium]
MFSALSRFVQAHPRRLLAASVALVVVAGAFGGSVAKRLGPYGADDPASESVKADNAFRAAAGREPSLDVLVLVKLPGGVSAPGSRRRVDRVDASLRGEHVVKHVDTYFATHNRQMLSKDGRLTWIGAYFRPVSDKQRQDAAKRISDRLGHTPGVILGGSAVAQQQLNEQVSKDLAHAEMLAFPLLFLLSLWFFRSLVASLLPPLLGGLSIVLTFAALRIVNTGVDISVFALNLTTGLGLGLAIDYSLFIVSRYREELAGGLEPAGAIGRTLQTAGRTVVFSSLTVAAALASLLVFPQRFLYSMGVGGLLVTLIAATAAVVVLPALLLVLGHRVNALAPRALQRRAQRDARPADDGAWYRLSRVVMRRPGRIAAMAAAVLIALGLPFAGIRFTSVDASVLGAEHSARQADNILKARFAADESSPIRVIVGAPANSASARGVAARARRLPAVRLVAPPAPVGGSHSVVNVVTPGRPYSASAKRLVRDLRALPAAANVQVAGQTASFLDLQASLRRHLPITIAIVLAATFLVLFLFTGSVVLPLKAALMNFLTLSAAFGILVMIFQHGRLEGLLDYTSQGALEQTQPVLLFAIVFGLSTDYGVFLLGRIKEARDGGASDRESVAIGLERTGRIVTAAAVLFCVAIGAFATSQIVFIKELGIGTALAVLIDATIVRALLVPSLMELLGKWNWWAPRPLVVLHRRLGLREA